MARKTLAVKIDRELHTWFKEFFPMHGAAQWFLESCLLQLKDLHDEGKIESPVDLVTLSVKEISEESL